MKIVFFGLRKKDQEFFLSSLDNTDISFVDERLDEKNKEKAIDADIICISVDSTVDKNTLDTLPNLKFITTRSTGYDNIDYQYAEEKGILVSNVPDYGSRTVAEFTFGLILNLSRNIIKANNYVKETLSFDQPTLLEGFDLGEKTLGIIGTGQIGKNVLKISQGFGMKVLAYDLIPDLDFAKDNNFEYKSFNDVISNSDILTFHIPSNKNNYHLINKETISMMKKGVYLINTARGDIIDTEALVWGLEKGIIAGAGLDVLEDEKELKEKISLSKKNKSLEMHRSLVDMSNVIMTPHVAFFSSSAVAKINKTTILNVEGFINKSPVNLVNFFHN